MAKLKGAFWQLFVAHALKILLLSADFHDNE
jgi:hypothetical protein